MTNTRVWSRAVCGLLTSIVGIPLAGCERVDARFAGSSEKELVGLYVLSVLNDDAATADATIREVYRRGEQALPVLEEASAMNQRTVDLMQQEARRMAAFLGAGSPEVRHAEREVASIRNVGLNLLAHKGAIAKGEKQPKVAVIPG